MMDQATRAAINRARHLARVQQGLLELWRLRGRAAASASQPRQLPPIATRDAAVAAQRAAAWLAGYDGAARAPQPSITQERLQ